jgi:hypothetical protein
MRRVIQASSTWAGNGTSQHLSGELFKMMTGVNMSHVPYRGGTPALTDFLGGQVHVYFGTTASSVEFIRSGKLRALAVTTATRSEAPPGLPTVADFVPGYEVSEWSALAHPGTRGSRSWTSLTRKINRGPRRSQTEGAVCRPGRRSVPQFTRRLWQTHRRRDREMGQGDPGDRHHGLVLSSPPIADVGLPPPARNAAFVSSSNISYRCRL